MSLQPSAQDVPAVEQTKQIRPLLAWGLLGVNALWLFIAVEKFLFPGEGLADDFTYRAFYSFGELSPEPPAGGILSIGLVGILQIALPVLAVLLVTHLQPAVANPKPYLLTALVEFGVSALFGLIAFFASFSVDSPDDGRVLTEMAFFRLGLFILLALAAVWTFKIAQPYLLARRQYGYAGGWQGQGWQGQPQNQPGGWQGQQPGQQGWQGQGWQGQQPGQPQQGWPQPGVSDPSRTQPLPPQNPGQQQWPQG